MKKIIGGLAGLSLVILIHECGHFIFAKLFDVATPVFSVGFGPALISIPINETIFQIAILPIGGYVELDPTTLEAQPYVAKMIIMLGGILFNIIFAYIVIWSTTIKNTTTTVRENMKATLAQITANAQKENTIIGPIGIISMLGTSLTINPQLFWLMLALISINIGLFNLIPLPFLDGGKALFYTIEAITGNDLSSPTISYMSALLIGLFILFLVFISICDIKRYGKKNHL
jgi:regulator of sigma E protease